MKEKKHEKAAAAAAAADAAGKAKRPDNWRETVESIVVAFVLAFLFRTFEAEAFVIPTGSMAPTLYGQHRDVYCAQCGTRFAVGVSSVPSSDAEIRNGEIVPGYRSHFAVCPNANCQFPNDVLDREMFAGDRILVNKFPYEFGEPQRWDVVVFKFPEQAKTNYIKRLVGLPGEQIMLWGGDVWVRRLDSDDSTFRIARKAPDKQRQLQLLVHDNDHPASQLLSAGWPESWNGADTTAWEADPRTRSFDVDAAADDSERPHWLRYSHYLPTAADWNNVLNGRNVELPEPELIRDFYAYNARITAEHAASAVSNGRLPELPPDPMTPEQWVGDLTLSCSVETRASSGELTFELVEGWRRHHCRIDLSTGLGVFAVVHEQDRDLPDPTAEDQGGSFETGMKKPGVYSISFANVDDRLCFWVDGRLVKSLEFNPDSKNEPQPAPIHDSPLDRSPIGIGARGAKLRVSHLKVERDIYYLNETSGNQSRDRKFDLRDDPDDSQDEFLMLGDNSPRSNDSRAWQTTHSVPRHLLIGKAFFVYWPHAVPFLNDGRGYAIAEYEEPDHRGPAGPPLPKFSLPFYPQVGRMHRIR